MRRAPAATPRMRPELRPKKLTRRSASPSGKVFKMMASVSRAGMKCRRVRLGRGIRRVSEQAGRTCRTKLNNIEAKAEQCARGELVEESGKRAAWHRHSCLCGVESPFEQPSSKT